MKISNHSNYLSMLVIALLLPLMPASAFAHVRWALDSVTPPRTNDTGLKANPCGGVARTARSTIFSAGQTIEVRFEETINHPGHYRIAFSPADDLNFDSYVLVDNIPDNTNTGFYTQEITIPMEICSACTLQLIQVMTTSPTPLPSDYYYSCSDIQITNSGDATPPQPVDSLNAQNGNGQVGLSWNNPAGDFYQVVVLKDTNPIADTPVNGVIYSAGDMINTTQVVYAGSANGFTATSLTNDTPYYFKVFSQNPRKNYATGMEINATPTASATAGGNTGNPPGDMNNTDSGGGALNILFLFAVLIIRAISSGKFR